MFPKSSALSSRLCLLTIHPLILIYFHHHEMPPLNGKQGQLYLHITTGFNKVCYTVCPMQVLGGMWLSLANQTVLHCTKGSTSCTNTTL